MSGLMVGRRLEFSSVRCMGKYYSYGSVIGNGGVAIRLRVNYGVGLRLDF